MYTLLLYPLVVLPPNNTAVLLLTDVRVNELIGGGLSLATFGVIHSPKNYKKRSLSMEPKNRIRSKNSCK